MDYKPFLLKFLLISFLMVFATNGIGIFIVGAFVDREEAIIRQASLQNYKNETENFLGFYKGFLENTDDHNLPRKLRRIFNDFVLKYKIEPSLLELRKSKDKAVFNRLGKTDVSEPSFPSRKGLYKLSYILDNNDEVNMSVNLEKLTTINYKIGSYKFIYLLTFGILNLACMLGLVLFLQSLFKGKIKDSQKNIATLSDSLDKAKDEIDCLKNTLERETFFSGLKQKIIQKRNNKRNTLLNSLKVVSEYIGYEVPCEEMQNLVLDVRNEISNPIGSEFLEESDDILLSDSINESVSLLSLEMKQKKISYSLEEGDATVTLPKRVLIMTFFNILKSVVNRMSDYGSLSIVIQTFEKKIQILVKNSAFNLASGIGLNNSVFPMKTLKKISTIDLVEILEFYGYKLEIDDHDFKALKLTIYPLKGFCANKTNNENNIVELRTV